MSEDEKYVLTESEKQLAHSWVSKYVKKCPICGNSTFHLSETVMEMRSLPYGIIGGRYQFYPVIVLVCAKCAYTMQFNANLMGFGRKLGVDEKGGKEGTDG